ncbi:Cytochrome P450 89A2 [Vitis vinifera]|uniref:Cytochrome P450 89A2 n=1 Tax=Vitis vinifera TaxID=29760 RepID=A0A438CEG8_VITVI|nr:Cytochrome P450 89A2 [Vitis vinifera]
MGLAYRSQTSSPPSETHQQNGHNVSCAHYGPTWRLLRRNLTLEILHPSRIRLYSHARKWALEILKSRLQCHSEICSGDGSLPLPATQFLANGGKITVSQALGEFLQICKDEEEVLIPLIRGRQRLNHDMQRKQKQDSNDLSSSSKDYFISYVDTLLDLQLPDEKRKLNEGEIVSLCSEFLGAGTDTTSTALQWIMANLVKYPHIQVKLFEEIMGVVGVGEKEVKEEDLQKMPYLKAVILEGLRRHPPGHFVSPHSVTQRCSLRWVYNTQEYYCEFHVAEIGRNQMFGKIQWSSKPERFLNKNAILHLEYFVANWWWSFEWKAVEGDEVDLSEKQELSTVMKNPLKAAYLQEIEIRLACIFMLALCL